MIVLTNRRPPTRKVKIVLFDTEGTKVLKSKSISVFESNIDEVFEVIKTALVLAANEPGAGLK